MYKNVLLASVFSLVALAGCSANQSSIAPTDVGAAAGVDPRIPALVINGKPLTAAEKAAYDQGIDVQIARFKTVE